MSSHREDLIKWIFDRMEIDDLLSHLPEKDQVLCELVYAYRCPADYTGEWPPTSESVGQYMAVKEGRKRPYTDRAIQKRHARALACLRKAARDRCAE